MTDLVLEQLPDVSSFEEHAGAFLGAREAENNLPLGLITGIKGGRTFGPLPPYFAVVRRAGAVVAAAMRTPPHNLILTDGSDPDALPLIVEDAHRAMPDTPGLSGPRTLASRAVDLWCERTGAKARSGSARRARATTPRPPRPTST